MWTYTQLDFFSPSWPSCLEIGRQNPYFRVLLTTKTLKHNPSDIRSESEAKSLVPPQGRSQDFPLGGGGNEVIFLEKCSLLVDWLGRTSECYIEVKQKEGGLAPFWLRLCCALTLPYIKINRPLSNSPYARWRFADQFHHHASLPCTICTLL